MLRITPRESPEAAKAYYFDKSRADYYAQGQESVGDWGGKGAERLGLEGKVENKAFEALCDNVNPQTGERLTLRNKEKRVPGWDLNFGVPKSVSVVYAWNADPRILQAFRDAMRETMEELEQLAATRVRKGGNKDGERITGELIWAEFIHLTARPEAETPDPHMHGHCFVFNATYDDVEKCHKAARLLQIWLKAHDFNTNFFTRLSNHLNEAGYPTRVVGHAFEIEGVPDSVNEYFSKRTAVIEATAKRLGITDPEEKDKLGALTRKSKTSVHSFDELRAIWRAEVSEAERQAMDHFLKPRVAERLGMAKKIEMVNAATVGYMEQVAGKRVGRSKFLLGKRSAMSIPGVPKVAVKRTRKPVDSAVERVAVDRSIRHNFERASVVTEGDICSHALRLGYGTGMTPEGMLKAMKLHPGLIFGEVNGQKLVTSQGVLAEELANVKWVRDGMGTMKPILKTHKIRDERLNDEQRAAVLHVLKSTDRVTAIDGKSGTGKTTLMKEAVAAMEAEGHKVLVMAPGTTAVEETLKPGGFKNAQTVAQLLVNQKLQDEYRNAVWWVDEAGQLSSRSLHQLIELAQKLDSRIVVSGDVMQHRAVERGDALRMLYEHADLKPAVVSKILRQKGNFKQVMELFASGQTREAMEMMDQMGWIQEKSFRTRYKDTAALYVQRTNEGRRPLVVAPTHFEGRLLREQIRAVMKAQGYLKDERPVEVLREIHMSAADRSDWRQYEKGQVVEYVQRTDGTEAGARRVIDSVDREIGHVYVKVPVGATQSATHFLDIEEHSDKIRVYEARTLMLGTGDRIRINKNGAPVYGKTKLKAGGYYTVTGFDEHGDIKLDNGMTISKSYGHIAQGETSTSYGAQSKTVDHVIIVASTVSFAAVNMQQAYVSPGRAIERADWVTNDKEALFDAAETSSLRMSAMDLVKVAAEKKLPDHLVKRPTKEVPREPRKSQKQKPEPVKPPKSVKPLKTKLGKTIELPQPQPKSPAPEPLKKQLGRRTELPVRNDPVPLWTMPPAPVQQPQSPKPLRQDVGEHRELPHPGMPDVSWRMPPVPPSASPVSPPAPELKSVQPELNEDLIEDMDEDFQPPMLP